MSIPTSDYGRDRTDRYNMSPTIVPSSTAYLTPPSPYCMEARRDSVASTQSSLSSFASCVSEYSGPVTPVSGQSPMEDESYVDVMPYDLRHEFHGMALDQPQKSLPCDQNLYSSWQMIPSGSSFSEGQSAQFPPQLVLPTAAEFPATHMTHHTGMDTVIVPTMDSSWNHFPSVISPNVSQHWGSHELGHVVTDGSMQPLWPDQSQATHGGMDTIIPSASMVDVDDSYVHLSSDAFTDTDTDTFVHGIPNFSQSPQEVSFKRENSPPMKQESDSEDGPLLTRSIYVSPTGGKTVKKECSSRVSKKRTRSSKQGKGLSDQERKRASKMMNDDDMNDDDEEEDLYLNRVKLIQEDGFLYKDEETGRLGFCTTKPTGTKSRCTYKDERGMRCTSVFKRPEHLKRHERTHNPERGYPCRICSRKFNRHDNLQAHILTHLRIPGKKDGRNPKFTLKQLEPFCLDPITGPKLIEKLHQKWRSEGGDWPKAKL